ncbi:hypothetical protein BH24ACT8_BH24ACT8_11320 [soil metagenome]
MQRSKRMVGAWSAAMLLAAGLSASPSTAAPGDNNCVTAITTLEASIAQSIGDISTGDINIVIDADSSGGTDATLLLALLELRADLNAALDLVVDLQAQIDALQVAFDAALLVVADADLQAQIDLLQAELDALLLVLDPDYPLVVALQCQIDLLQAELDAQLLVVADLRAEIDALDPAVDQAEIDRLQLLLDAALLVVVDADLQAEIDRLQLLLDSAV